MGFQEEEDAFDVLRDFTRPPRSQRYGTNSMHDRSVQAAKEARLLKAHRNKEARESYIKLTQAGE